MQLAAQATGGALLTPPREVCELTRERSDAFLDTTINPGSYSKVANPEFDAMIRLMERKDPSFKN